MKKIISCFMMIAILFATILVSCKGGDDVPVTDVKLNRTSTIRATDSKFMLDVKISPDNATNKNVNWTSSTDAVATITNGTVSTLKSGTSDIVVTTVDGSKTDTCLLTVVQGCNSNTPGFGESLGNVSFKTSKTWKVGNQEWSDVVIAEKCQKTTFSGGNSTSNNYNADCRTNDGYGDLFSYCAVVRFQDALCPDGWRAPTTEEFVVLDKELGGIGEYQEEAIALLDKYIKIWGGEYGGRCVANGTLAVQDSYGHYWSLSEYEIGRSYAQGFNLNGDISPDGLGGKFMGFTLRCVR